MCCRGTESDTSHLPRVLVQCLQMSVSTNVMELHLARLPRHHQQPAWVMTSVTSVTCSVARASPVGSTHTELTQPPDLMESSPLMALPLDFVVEPIMPGIIIVVIVSYLNTVLLTSNALTHNCVDTL